MKRSIMKNGAPHDCKSLRIVRRKKQNIYKKNNNNNDNA